MSNTKKIMSYTSEYEVQLNEYFSEFENEGKSYQSLSMREGYGKEQLGNVQDATFIYVEEESKRVIGLINIRYGLNAYLFEEGGHVGYSVRPSEQGKGYGKELLEYAKALCAFIGLEKILVICEKDNIASAKIIVSCGGEIEDEVKSKENGKILQRYWIDVQ